MRLWLSGASQPHARLAHCPSSLPPYPVPADLGFLYHLTRSKQSPPLALFGWYFLLAFVFATIPAGIYGEAPTWLQLPAARGLQPSALLTAQAPPHS